MASQPGNLDTYFKIFAGVQEQIRFADSKAVFVAALNTLLFGFIATHFGGLKTMYKAYGVSSVSFWGPSLVSLMYLLSSMGSLLLAVVAVMSRFGTLAPHSRVFFGHIAGDYVKDYAKYYRETHVMTAECWAQDLSNQIVEVSHIASTKHRLIRWAAICALMAGGLWFAALMLFVFMTP